MKELQDRILADGQVIGNNILKVDAFLNHQIDPQFILKIGAELAARFNNEGVTKVLTVEASGIAVAMAAALTLGVPVVFAKKKQALTQEGDVYSAPVFSFTRKEHLEITVTKCYLSADDVVLIIDDFLAHGEALNGLISLVEQAGGKLAGAGIVIEKRFQKGGDAIRDRGVRVESLAAIERMQPGEVVFAVDGQRGKRE
ncbi:MAG: xanthine phosphoribosyltransferase [Firmicutes bacterium]|nr:xanthine phosphoribosyltransferase [Bacillota bacterium]